MVFDLKLCKVIIVVCWLGVVVLFGMKMKYFCCVLLMFSVCFFYVVVVVFVIVLRVVMMVRSSCLRICFFCWIIVGFIGRGIWFWLWFRVLLIWLYGLVCWVRGCLSFMWGLVYVYRVCWKWLLVGRCVRWRCRVMFDWWGWGISWRVCWLVFRSVLIGCSWRLEWVGSWWGVRCLVGFWWSSGCIIDGRCWIWCSWVLWSWVLLDLGCFR